MNTNQLTDFLCRENIGLNVCRNLITGCIKYHFQQNAGNRWLFMWDYGSYSVSVWTLDDENIDCFIMSGQSLSDVLDGIRDWRHS